MCVAAAGAKPSGCPVGAGLSHATATPARAWVLCVGEREEVDVGLYFYNLLSYLHPACAHEACVLSIHQCVLSDGIPPPPSSLPCFRCASSPPRPGSPRSRSPPPDETLACAPFRLSCISQPTCMRREASLRALQNPLVKSCGSAGKFRWSGCGRRAVKASQRPSGAPGAASE